MKMLVVSDSHWENEILEKITNKYPTMDFYIHCGDSSLKATDPLIEKYHVVLGNHDEDHFPIQMIVEVGTKKCLIIHGHKHNVYNNYEMVEEFMKKNDIALCCHGHTHIPTIYRNENRVIINPGSVMMNRASYGYGTYAIITIEDTIEIEFFHHKTHVECSKHVLKNGRDTLNKIKYLFVQQKR